MKLLKLHSLLFIILISCYACSVEKKNEVQIDKDYNISTPIPIGENSWVSPQNTQERIITEKGIRNWSNPEQKIKTYIRINDTGKLHLGINLKPLADTAHLKVTVGSQTAHLTVHDSTYQDLPVGTFTIETPGYQKITISSENPDKGPIADIDKLLLGGAATKKEANFVTDNFHFGRRGPSVHLNYPLPSDSKKPLYFYNEIEVPKGEDVIGSYFMANGFSHGYFGMQVNSAKERRILFSVWSPYDTQNPEDIPEDQRIELLKKGEQVHGGKFGNEGSGGQSFKKFMWETETTYRFLLKGEPYDETHTDYTAYFYAPEKEKWELIAKFRRPETHTYLSSLYSFLENFSPAHGDTSRKALYKNQWIYDKDQGWFPLKTAKFTADATARKEDRWDYAGGEVQGGYYLKNGGFFDEYTPIDSSFKRQSQKEAPTIDFENLP